jgi:hypothetical protein
MERFHSIDQFENEDFGSTTIFIKKEEVNKVSQDDCNHQVVKQTFHYEVYKKNDFISLGYYSYNQDHFREERFMSEVVYPFNKDGFLEPIFKRTSWVYFIYWSDEEEVDHKSTLINTKVTPKLQAKMKKQGINFDLSQKRIISW